MQLNSLRCVRGLSLWALALLLILPGQSVAASDEQNKFADIESYVDGTIESQMVLEDIPAVTVSIVKGGKRIFSKGYGMADIDNQVEVNAESSLFRIGSTSKLFTWTAIMQLYEKGLVDLDADVNSYLDFKIPDTFEKPITLRHILTHTAGFEEGGLGYLIHYYPNKGPELATAMEQFMPKRLNPPGEVSSYSNYATALAGLIVQNVTGQPFNDYIDEHIFEPLNMTYTTFAEPLPKDMEKYRVKGYAREAGLFDEKPFEVINSFGPAGAVSSSANDMAKFMMANLNNGELNGNRILKAETVRLMHSQLFSGDDRLAGMAYGFYEHNYNGHRLIAHGGDTMQFHTDMVIDKDENFGVFVSYMTTVSGKARNAFVKQIYDHYFPEESQTITPPSDFSERADKYAGSYIFWRRNDSTIEKALGLFDGGTEVAPTADNTLLVAGVYGERQYVEIGKNLFKQVDGHERIAFIEDESGDVTGLYYESLPFMALQRTPALQTGFFRVILPLLSLLILLHVLISWGYKRGTYRKQTGASKGLTYSAIATAGMNYLFIIFFTIVILVYQESLFSGLPLMFKVTLLLPILAVVLSLVTAYFFVKRQMADKPGLASTIYYALVVFAGLYMSFIYYYWNFLGWNYK